MDNINNFIDYQSMFDHLFSDHETDLYEYQYENDAYKLLLDFDLMDKDDYKIELDECDLNSKKVIFVFIKGENDYTITYDRVIGEFEDCKFYNDSL